MGYLGNYLRLNKNRNHPPGRPNRKKISRYLYNWLSMSGILLIIVSLLVFLTIFLIETISGITSSYLGIIYLFLHTAIFLGLIMAPVGMLIERRAQLRGATTMIFTRWTIDFAKQTHRRIVLTFILSCLLIAISGGLGTYKIYHLTEKTEFCGMLCHTAMHPEWTTHQNSPHARVKCVDCHISSGEGWYVRSKASGVSQVLAVMNNSFPRPIPTPITKLRPTQQTCEKCHWPNRFIGNKETVRNYYLTDENNTNSNLRLLMKIGGQESSITGGGIHYHMMLTGRIEYIARDDKRQDIPFVRVTRKDGSREEFNDAKSPLSEEERASLATRALDCMDCHNRPAHPFRPPIDTVNAAMASGLISTELPYIKREALRALNGEYMDTDEAITNIANQLRRFYQKNYPKIFDQDSHRLSLAIAEIQNIYRLNIFPEMKVSWNNYPNNLGHREWPGCFRCHNDNMVSENGNKLFRNCYSCHLILAQSADRTTKIDFSKGLPFIHPDDGITFEKYVACNKCHGLNHAHPSAK